MKKLSGKLQQFWAHEKSLTILSVILIVHIFIVIPFGQNTIFQKVVFFVFYIGLLSAGLFMLTKNAMLRIVITIALGAMVLFSSGIIISSFYFALANNIIIVLYCILMSWVVLVRTFSDGPVTLHRVQGSIAVYLLISFIFALLYHSIYLIDPGAFKGLNSSDKKELMYFSLTTLTTTGYGDITPALAASRSLANLEGLIGQLYPAILIARLVSMEFESSKKKKAE
jgi:hypothetical protein